MTIHFGNVDASSVVYIPFHTFDSNGASITLTGLAVTDIEIYKNGSATQRTSDNGYTLLDTDGIDFDGITGIHGFSIDLSDNSDSGFYSAGAFYWVVVSSVTVDTRTVNFVAATFRIGPAAANMTQILGTVVSAPATAGVLDVNVKNIDNDAASASGTVTFPNATIASTTNITAGTITTATNVTTVNGLATGVITAAAIATDAIDNDAIAANAVTEIQAGLATAASIAALNNLSAAQVNTEVDTALADVGVTTTVTGRIDAAITTRASQASVDTVAGYIDTEVASILAAVDTEVAAIKAKTDQLVFTTANQVDATAVSISAGAVTAAAVATGAIDADALATDAVNEIADGVLNRDMSTGTDSGTATVRTVRQALRFLRNKWAVSGTTLTVYKEDDTAASWTGTVSSDAAADPITGNDPASS